MSYTIAITGKGGVGKTTVSALTVLCLIASERRPVLAVDADPNTCLDTALGLRVEHTVGGIREEARALAGQGNTTGIAKQELLRIKIEKCLIETRDFDLIAMGRSEGPGCYCYANNALRTALKEIADNYPYVVIDNEAGLENLSRRIVRKLDLMIMVADPSKQGLETVRRLYRLAKEMDTKLQKLVVIINRAKRDVSAQITRQLQEETGAAMILTLPEDEELAKLAEDGSGLQAISLSNPLVTHINRLLVEVGVQTGPVQIKTKP